MIRVLIVDDNTELCETLRLYLDNQSDMTVVGVAYNGEQAIQQILQLLPDVVLLDIIMPQLDGMAVLERIKSEQRCTHIRFIVITALGRDCIVKQFTQLGVDYFLVKPFDPSVVAERIRQFATPITPSIMQVTRSNYQNSSTVEQEFHVSRLLHEIGVPPHYKGYKYLHDAVLMVLHNQLLLGGSLTKVLYPALAKKYNTTSSAIEAAIRNCVLSCWNSGNRDFICLLTAQALPEKKNFPTNSIIIAKLADAVRLGMQNKVS